MTIQEKVAYLKGLTEGLGIDVKKNEEGRLIALITQILGDISDELVDLREEQELLGDAVDAISDDLSDIEDFIDDSDDENDEECYAAVCPSCGDDIYFDDSILESGEIVCPGCGQSLNFDFSDLSDETSQDDDT